MKIAIFVKNKKFKALPTSTLYALIFNIVDDKVEYMEKDLIFNMTINYLSLWLIKNEINIIYLQSTDDKINDYLRKLDIEVKTYEDLENNLVLKAFLKSFE